MTAPANAPSNPPDRASSEALPRVAVVGAGAVGCYYGAMLARGGCEVILIARPAHVAAIERDGLRLQTSSLDEQVRLQASTQMDAVRGAALVLFCVKSTDTEEAAQAMAPHLAEDALVLSLQNGVDNAERLRQQLRQTVAASVVYVATEMAGPGHVRHHGRGELVLEEVPGIERATRALQQAGVPVHISSDVRAALWVKLILNSAYNALSAIANQPYGQLVQAAGVPEVIDDIVAECVAVAHADGVRLPADLPEAVRRIAQTMPAQYSSTAQDLGRGKRTEIDHLNGYVLRRGEALKVPTPVNRVLHTLVRLLENRGSSEAAGG